MKVKQYLQIKKQWEKIKEELSNEAILDGCPPTELERALSIAKSRVFDNWGIDFYEFEEADRKLGDSEEKKEVLETEIEDI